MAQILPPPTDLGSALGQAIGQGLGSGIQRGSEFGFQRQMGLSALDQAEQQIANAKGDPYKIALAFARAGVNNPFVERALGPLYAAAVQANKTQNAFPGEGQPPLTPASSAPSSINAPSPLPTNLPQNIPNEAPGVSQPAPFATPSPFNIMTPQDINVESERYARAVNDPNAFQTRQAQLLTQNQTATNLKAALEESALNAGVTPAELPRFMIVGSQFDPRNPAEWAQNAKREYMKVKSNDEKLRNAFIPGLGSGLLGRDRNAFLNKLNPIVQDQVKRGLEQETRNFLADNYLTPTEIEERIHPLTDPQKKAIDKLPSGAFPAKIAGEPTQFGRKPRRPSPFLNVTEENPFISYEEALERAPKQIKIMQDQLADFFKRNVTSDTSLLPLRQKIWEEKDYDWRQFGPAIRQAISKGLKLTPQQSTELSTIETQAPYQSLPEIFQSFDRIVKFLRGNK